MLKFLLFQNKVVTQKKPPSPSLDVRELIKSIRKFNKFQTLYSFDENIRESRCMLISKSPTIGLEKYVWVDDEQLLQLHFFSSFSFGTTFGTHKFVQESLEKPERYNFKIELIRQVAVVESESGKEMKFERCHLLKIKPGKFKHGTFTKSSSKNEIVVVPQIEMTKQSDFNMLKIKKVY